MGMDRVLLAMESEGVALPGARGVRCFVVAMGGAAQTTAGALVRELRNAGVSAASAFAQRPIGAQMKMADRAGADFVAIIGDQELAEGVVTIRRLVDGIQKSIPVGEVAGWLTRLDDGAEAT